MGEFARRRVKHFHPALERLQQRVVSFDMFVGSYRHNEGKVMCSGVLGCRTDVANMAVVKRIECATCQNRHAGLEEIRESFGGTR